MERLNKYRKSNRYRILSRMRHNERNDYSTISESEAYDSSSDSSAEMGIILNRINSNYTFYVST